MQDATQFIILEAKMFSDLSSGVSNAKYFDQAARNVACIAEVFHRAKLLPEPLLLIGFYVLAPNSQIEEGKFSKVMKRSSIEGKVERRVKEYGGDKDKWYFEWFQPVFRQMDIKVISWEELISTIGEYEPETTKSFDAFYRHCIEFNL